MKCRFLFRRICLVLLAVLCLAVVMFWRIAPSNSRNWKAHHARLPEVSFEGTAVHIAGVRDFRPQADGSYQERFDDRSYQLDSIDSLWFVLSVFHQEDWRGPAHSMLSFGFDDGQYVVISVEARKELDESYSAFRGLFKKYELIYVIGDERDLILTRAAYQEDDVYLYPVRATREKIRELFVDMLESARELHEKPQFYNTLTNNCTSRLRDHANSVVPGRIPQSWKLSLPGYSDELMEELGLLESDSSIEETRARYWVNDRARQFAQAEDFSSRIRQAPGPGSESPR